MAISLLLPNPAFSCSPKGHPCPGHLQEAISLIVTGNVTIVAIGALRNRIYKWEIEILAASNPADNC